MTITAAMTKKTKAKQLMDKHANQPLWKGAKNINISIEVCKVEALTFGSLTFDDFGQLL